MRDLAIRFRYSGVKPAPDDTLSAAALSFPSTPSFMRPRASATLCLCGLGIAASATIFAFLGTGLSLLTFHSLEAVRPEPQAAKITSDASATPIRGLANWSIVTSTQEGSRKALDQTGTRATPTGETKSDSGVSIQATTPRSEPASSGAMASGSTAPQTPTLQSDRQPIDMGTAAVAHSEMALPEPKGRGAETEATITAPLPAAEIKSLLLQGDAAFRRGDLTSARLLYRRAFETGEGRGALGIGATYDPTFLQRFRLWTQIADPNQARVWYLRAGELGAAEAKLRLDRLGAKTNR